MSTEVLIQQALAKCSSDQEFAQTLVQLFHRFLGEFGSEDEVLEETYKFSEDANIPTERLQNVLDLTYQKASNFRTKN